MHKIDNLVRSALASHLDGQKCILACSMGPDSTALLIAMHALREERALDLHAVYVDHGLRSESAEEGRQFLDWLAQWDIRGEVVRVEVKKQSSLLDAARRARYTALTKVAQAQKATVLLLGHTQTDQSETFLLRLLSGAGLRGLACMPIVQPMQASNADAPIQLVRPLLHATREDILDYLAQRNASFVQDPTNDKLIYRRNWIRHRLVPLIKQVNPSWENHIDNLTQQFQSDSQFLEQFAHEQLTRMTPQGHNQPALSSSEIRALPVAIGARVIRMWLQPCILNFEQTQAVLSLCQTDQGSQSLSIDGETTVTRQYKQLIKHTQIHRPDSVCVSIHGPGKYRWDDWQLIVKPLPTDDLIPINTRTVAVKSEGLSWPLVIRSRRAGDRIQLPHSAGHRKISDVLIDAKIPAGVRDQVPLLCSDSEVLWAVGVRVGQKLRAACSNVGVGENRLLFEWEQISEHG